MTTASPFPSLDRTSTISTHTCSKLDAPYRKCVLKGGAVELEARGAGRPLAARPTVWGLVRESAIRRLGKPLLTAYLVLLVLGAGIVGATAAWMYFGHVLAFRAR